MRTMTRLGILVQAGSKFFHELARCHPALYVQIERDTLRRFVERDGACFGFGKRSETRRQLLEVAQILADLVTRYRETATANLASYLLMARAFDEQCEMMPSEARPTVIQVKG